MIWHAWIEGTPVAQPRQRHTRTGICYLPKSHPVHAWKAAIVRKWRDDGAPVFERGRPLVMVLYFSFVRPKSHYRSNGTLKAGVPHYMVGRPDRDNMDKAVMDALNGLAYHDDSQIVGGTSWKFYHEPGSNAGLALTLQYADESREANQQ